MDRKFEGARRRTIAMAAAVALLGVALATVTTVASSVAGVGVTPAGAVVSQTFEGSISAGNTHSCGVTRQRQVACWGFDNLGELGTGTTPTKVAVPTPQIVVGLDSTPIASVGVGVNFSCALSVAGGVWCWGNGAFGQLGNGTTAASNVPVDPTGLSSDVEELAVGAFGACAIRTNGEVRCWGSNLAGAAGADPITTTTVSTPRTIPTLDGTAARAVHVSVGSQHNCAVLDSGGAVCWGQGQNGQLGSGAPLTFPTYVLTPVGVAGLSSGVVSISAGKEHTCAVLSSGAAKCWGYGVFGVLGGGTTTTAHAPVDVIGMGSGVAQVVAGEYVSCARKTDGTVWCWGTGGYGELAGVATSSTVPVELQALGTQNAYVHTGAFALHVCATKDDGTAWCWGWNHYGQLGRATGSAPAAVDTALLFGPRPNTAPTADPQSVTALGRQTTPITLTASDPESDPLQFTVSSYPSQGTLSCVGADCTFDPDPGASGPDSFEFTVEDPGGLTDVATVQIDIVDAPRITVGQTDKMEPESGTVARGFTLPVVLSHPSPVPLTLKYVALDGTATVNADFPKFGTLASPRSLVIPAGATRATIGVPVKDDAVVEGDEFMSVQVLSVTGGPAVLVGATGLVTIRDADSVVRADPALPLLTATSSVQAEGDAPTPSARRAQVKVELSKAATSEVRVTYRTEPGTATPGVHYTTKTGTLVFAPGQFEKTVDLTVFADEVPEGFRAIRFAITGVTGPVHQVDTFSTVYIVDED